LGACILMKAKVVQVLTCPDLIRLLTRQSRSLGENMWVLEGHVEATALTYVVLESIWWSGVWWFGY